MATYSRTLRHGEPQPSSDDGRFFLEHGRTRVPRLVQWMATLRCPLSCEHCLAGGDAMPDMEAVEAAELIEQVADLGVEEFLLTGGEPLARPDLPEIIGMLSANGVRWSLNTALMPDRRNRRAIEQWPPSFVAVSVDGPEPVHDAFRGCAGTFRRAMDSIGYFANLASAGVAAGTTVTTKNFPHLGETFGVVLESGATQWGLHLLVPEGRAATRKDLFLSRRQLRELLGFAASKRNHFPVTMADEIGYCGTWEPLVRSEPFFCGAGRVQCVVLPDGEVVPCTTLDRSVSAGSVLKRSLREIWETGFAPLRSWRPQGRCRSCDYASACEGGCWLQRRHGTGCFRQVWSMPRAVTAAGLAVCLGLAASGRAAEPEEPTRAGRTVAMTDAEAAKMEVLQRSIILWYASQYPRQDAPDTVQVLKDLEEKLPEDPGAKYFLSFARGERSTKIEDRADAIAEALGTKQRSLCLIDVAWRDVTEWCFEGPEPAQRTDAQKKALREVTAKLDETAETWRTEIFSKKLDPFLRRPEAYRHFMRSKRMPDIDQRIEYGIGQKRWHDAKDLTGEFLAEHAYAEIMEVKYTVSEGAGLKCVRGGKVADADGTLRVFDLLIVPDEKTVPKLRLTMSLPRDPLDVTLPPGTELTYGDVLRLVREQNPKLPLAAFERSPLMLPLLLEEKRKFEANPDNAGKPVPQGILWPLVNFYLF